MAGITVLKIMKILQALGEELKKERDIIKKELGDDPFALASLMAIQSVEMALSKTIIDIEEVIKDDQ